MSRNTVLTLTLLLGTAAYAEASKNDAETVEEMTRFADESSKMREDHIKQMRELHVKHINEMYDRKLSHNAEMTLLWKQMKPGDKKVNKELRTQIKDKKKAFQKEDEKFREDFKDNVLNKKHKEFREIMHTRMKDLKDKFKD
jgi:exonuclease VII large subunit